MYPLKYVTGIHALNLPCHLETTGDWHSSWIQWKYPTIQDTQKSVFGDWGIENNRSIPEHSSPVPVANHLRACLDMLEMGDFSNLQGMNKDYISNDKYTDTVFQKVGLLRKSSLWPSIDRFLEKEYLMKWIRYKKEHYDDKLEVMAN